ncbi:hypothetical protein V8F33_006180 [Rhypophila sp. PSN 637]
MAQFSSGMFLQRLLQSRTSGNSHMSSSTNKRPRNELEGLHMKLSYRTGNVVTGGCLTHPNCLGPWPFTRGHAPPVPGYGAPSPITAEPATNQPTAHRPTADTSPHTHKHDNPIIHHAPFPTPSPTSSAILFSTPRTPRPPQTPDLQIPDSGRSAVGGGHSFMGVIARKHVLVREGATHVSQYDEDDMFRVVRVIHDPLSVCLSVSCENQSQSHIRGERDGCSWTSFFPSFPLSALRRLSLVYKTLVQLKLMIRTHYIPTMVMWSTDCVAWYCLLGF